MKINRLQFGICLLLLALGSSMVLAEAEKVRELNKDIVLLNLINGLYLTAEQTESLIDIIVEADMVRETYEKAFKKREKEFEKVLKDVKEVLMSGDEIPEDLKHRVHKMKEIQHGLEDERGEKLIRLESQVEGFLTQNQLATIDAYKPCTIPPAQGKIGQSVETAAEGLVRQLGRIRKMDGYRYEMMKDMFVDIHLGRVEKFVGFQSPEEKENYGQDILDTYAKVRSLSDKEFLLQKDVLAKNLMPEDEKIRKRRKNQLGRVGHFLMDSALIPILEERLKQNQSITE